MQRVSLEREAYLLLDPVCDPEIVGHSRRRKVIPNAKIRIPAIKRLFAKVSLKCKDPT